MLGHKAEAEAVVIMREKLHESGVQHGADYSRWHYVKWRFVVEVRPEAGPAYRAAAEQEIPSEGFDEPVVGNAVRVEYHEKEPDKVTLLLKGDARYDHAVRRREAREWEKSGRASRDAAFREVLDAPPGSPPPGGWPEGRRRQ
jgi:hypothetical protein